MKKLILLILLGMLSLAFSSCRNKTVQLLTKKWDCVRVDNIIPADTKFLSAGDSANAEQVRLLLQSLSWTFKPKMRYECAINNRVTVQGNYELMNEDKILICTPESKNNVNRYIIKTITENELVLSGYAENTAVVLHFKPN